MQHGDTITGFYVKTVPFIQQVLNTDTGFSHNDNNFSSTPSGEMPHFFTSKEITKNDDAFQPTPINTENNDWVYGSFVLMLLFILAIKWIYPTRVKQMLNAFTLPKNRNLFTRDGNLHNEGFSVLFIFLAVITYSLLVLFSLQSFNILPSPLSSEMKVNYYFSFLLLSAGFIIIKLGLMHLAGLIFNTGTITMSYVTNSLIAVFSTTVIIIPFIVIYFFSGYHLFLYAAIFIFLVIQAIRITQGIMIGKANPLFSYFHLFLYICTLEVLPVFIVVKLVDLHFL